LVVLVCGLGVEVVGLVAGATVVGAGADWVVVAGALCVTVGAAELCWMVGAVRAGSVELVVAVPPHPPTTIRTPIASVVEIARLMRLSFAPTASG
jgi:hypothetical protein